MPSAVIQSFAYDTERRELQVTFQSGRRYVYRDVPNELYIAMKQAFAKGPFFNKYIRDRFEFTRSGDHAISFSAARNEPSK